MKALVDDTDYTQLIRYKWHYSGGYAVTTVARRTQSMHAMIVGKRPGQVIDHINRNRLDNQRQNLRHATHAQNARNRLWQNKTGYRGVLELGPGNFKASTAGINLGCFPTAEQAAQVYNWASLRLYGEHAILNTTPEGAILVPKIPPPKTIRDLGRLAKIDFAEGTTHHQFGQFTKAARARRTHSKHYQKVKGVWHYRRIVQGEKHDINTGTDDLQSAKRKTASLRAMDNAISHLRTSGERIVNDTTAFKRARQNWENHKNIQRLLGFWSWCAVLKNHYK